MNRIVAAGSREAGALILLAAVAGLTISIFNDVWSGNGIHGTAGALLVVISCALMVASASVLMFANGLGRRLRGALVVLIALDILATGLAAYMLEATWLIAVMAIAMVGWVGRLASEREFSQSPSNTVAQRGTE